MPFKFKNAILMAIISCIWLIVGLSFAAGTYAPAVRLLDAGWCQVATTNIGNANFDTVAGATSDSSILLTRLNASRYQGQVLDLVIAPVTVVDSCKLRVVMQMLNAAYSVVATTDLDSITAATQKFIRLPLDKYPAPYYTIYIKGYTGNSAGGVYIQQVFLNQGKYKMNQ